MTREELLATPIAELQYFGLTVRSLDALEARGRVYVRDVIDSKPEELLELSQFGPVGITNLQESLRKLIRGDEPQIPAENFLSCVTP